MSWLTVVRGSRIETALRLWHHERDDDDAAATPATLDSNPATGSSTTDRKICSTDTRIAVVVGRCHRASDQSGANRCCAPTPAAIAPATAPTPAAAPAAAPTTPAPASFSRTRHRHRGGSQARNGNENCEHLFHGFTSVTQGRNDRRLSRVALTLTEAATVQ